MLFRTRASAASLALLLLLSLVLSLISARPVHASSTWLQGYQFRKSLVYGRVDSARVNVVVVRRGSGTDYYDASLSAPVLFLNNSVRSDYGDVIFTRPDGTPVPWVREYQNFTTAIYRVLAPQRQFDSMSITHLYHGNPSASNLAFNQPDLIAPTYFIAVRTSTSYSISIYSNIYFLVSLGATSSSPVVALVVPLSSSLLNGRSIGITAVNQVCASATYQVSVRVLNGVKNITDYTVTDGTLIGSGTLNTSPDTCTGSYTSPTISGFTAPVVTLVINFHTTSSASNFYLKVDVLSGSTVVYTLTNAVSGTSPQQSVRWITSTHGYSTLSMSPNSILRPATAETQQSVCRDYLVTFQAPAVDGVVPQSLLSPFALADVRVPASGLRIHNISVRLIDPYAWYVPAPLLLPVLMVQRNGSAVSVLFPVVETRGVYHLSFCGQFASTYTHTVMSPQVVSGFSVEAVSQPPQPVNRSIAPFYAAPNATILEYDFSAAVGSLLLVPRLAYGVEPAVYLVNVTCSVVRLTVRRVNSYVFPHQFTIPSGYPSAAVSALTSVQQRIGSHISSQLAPFLSAYPRAATVPSVPQYNPVAHRCRPVFYIFAEASNTQPSAQDVTLSDAVYRRPQPRVIAQLPGDARNLSPQLTVSPSQLYYIPGQVVTINATARAPGTLQIYVNDVLYREVSSSHPQLPVAVRLTVGSGLYTVRARLVYPVIIATGVTEALESVAVILPAQIAGLERIEVPAPSQPSPIQNTSIGPGIWSTVAGIGHVLAPAAVVMALIVVIVSNRESAFVAALAAASIMAALRFAGVDVNPAVIGVIALMGVLSIFVRR